VVKPRLLWECPGSAGMVAPTSSWDRVSPDKLGNPDAWSPSQNTLPNSSQNQQIIGHATWLKKRPPKTLAYE